MTVVSTLLKAPFEKVEVSTPYLSGTAQALCLKKPLYELIIGNIFETRVPDNPDETWCENVAADT